MPEATTVSSKASPEDGLFVPTCHVRLKGVARQTKAIQVNSVGQAALITDKQLYILTPSLGLDHSWMRPNLKSNLPHHFKDVISTPELREFAELSAKNGRTDSALHDGEQTQAQDFFQAEVHVNSLLPERGEGAFYDRPMVNSDYNAVIPASMDLHYISCSWSPPGFGPLGSCLLAAVDSDGDVTILHAPKNALRGPWIPLETLDLNQGWSTQETADARRKRTLGTYALAASWSPVLQCVQKPRLCVLAVGTAAGEVLLWTRQNHGEGPGHVAWSQQPLRLSVGSRPINQVVWGEVAAERHHDATGSSCLTMSLLAVIASVGPRLLTVHLSASGDIESCSIDKYQPPELTGYPQISLAELFLDRESRRHGVLISLPGQIKIWKPTTLSPPAEGTVNTNTWTQLRLGRPSPDGLRPFGEERDPHAVAVSLVWDTDANSSGSQISGRNSGLLTLSSGLQYRLNLALYPTSADSEGEPTTLLPQPTPATTTSEKEDTLQRLRLRVEARQTVNAWSANRQFVEPDSTPRLQVYSSFFTCQSDDEIAAFRVLTHRFVKVSFALSLPVARGNQGSGISRIEQMFSAALAAGFHISQRNREALIDIATPIQAMQPALTVFHNALSAAAQYEEITGSPVGALKSSLLAILLSTSVSLIDKLDEEFNNLYQERISQQQEASANSECCTRLLGQRLHWTISWALSQTSQQFDSAIHSRLVDLKHKLYAQLSVLHLIALLGDLNRDTTPPSSRGPARTVARRVLSVLRDVDQAAGEKAASTSSNWAKLLVQRLQTSIDSLDADRGLLASGAEADAAGYGEEICPACKDVVPLEMTVTFDQREDGPKAAVATQAGTTGPLTALSHRLASLEAPAYAKCRGAGHVWRRCGRTFVLLATPDVKTCVGCRLKVCVPLEQPAPSPAADRPVVGSGDGGEEKEDGRQSKRPRLSSAEPGNEQPVVAGKTHHTSQDCNDRCHLCGNMWVQVC
ncbi:unnamed protein product [Parajaminaea phylloscopi]